MLQDQYPAQPRILADDDADREAVPSALPGASMAHLACHGYSDPADPSSSRLLLGDGETLTAGSVHGPARQPRPRVPLRLRDCCVYRGTGG